jgi:putative ABC transport system substrate-binding protein
MNNRRKLVIALGASALAAPFASFAQQQGKVWRIGYLHPGSASLAPIRFEPLRQGLQALGYVEGRNLVLEARWGEGNMDRLRMLATELVQLKVDVIVTGGEAAAVAAGNATASVPIVMVDPGDPVRTKLVASLARPGGNVTGLSSAASDLAAKHLQLLKEAVPRVTRIGFLWNANAPAGQLALTETEKVAAMLGVSLQPIEVRQASDLDEAVAAFARSKGDAIIVFADPLTFTHRQRIMEMAAQRGLVAVSGAREFADAGGLMSYGPASATCSASPQLTQTRSSRARSPRICRSSNRRHSRWSSTRKTAKALGITIPQTVLMRADKLIE